MAAFTISLILILFLVGIAVVKAQEPPSPPPILIESTFNSRSYSSNCSLPINFSISQTVGYWGMGADNGMWLIGALSYSLDNQAWVDVGNNTISWNHALTNEINHLGVLLNLTGLSNGEHSIILRASYDVYLNVGVPRHYSYTYSSPYSFTVDAIPPVIYVYSPENKTYTSSEVPLKFVTLNPPISWIGYSLDNHSSVTVSDNSTITGLAEGLHSIVVYANDTVGNIGKSDTVFFTINTPTLTPISSPSPTITVSPIITPSESPTQQPTITPSPPVSPPLYNVQILFMASLLVALVVVGLLVYFRKRRG